MGNGIRAGITGTVILLLALLSGCGTEQGEAHADITTLRFDRDGAITHTIIEEFKGDGLDASELENMIESEIEEVTGTAGTIKLKDMDTVGDNIRVRMTYEDAGLFEIFNNEQLFYGTIGEAEQAGYAMRDGQFVNAQDENGSTMGAFDDTTRHVIVSVLKVAYDTPYKVLYMTRGSARISDTLIDATGVEEPLVYLILEK